MNLPRLARGTLFALLLGGALAPSNALAYCQLTTDQPMRSACPEQCIMSGSPVQWPDRDVLYTFNQALLPDMDDATTRRIFKQAFGAWADVSCGGLPIDLAIAQDPGTTSVSAADHTDNVNVVVYRTPSEWRRLHPLSERAFALTQVWYRTDNGDVVGADMELNGSLGTYRECPADGCEPGTEVDLGNVITHEAGHFLGMAHSDVSGSTMYCDAEPWQTDKRTLAEDDIEGVCSVYGGSAVGGVGSPSSKPSGGGGGCQAAPVGSPAPGLGAGLLLALAGWLRRRRG